MRYLIARPIEVGGIAIGEEIDVGSTLAGKGYRGWMRSSRAEDAARGRQLLMGCSPHQMLWLRVRAGSMVMGDEVVAGFAGLSGFSEFPVEPHG